MQHYFASSKVAVFADNLLFACYTNCAECILIFVNGYITLIACLFMYSVGDIP